MDSKYLERISSTQRKYTNKAKLRNSTEDVIFTKPIEAQEPVFIGKTPKESDDKLKDLKKMIKNHQKVLKKTYKEKE